MAVLNLCVSQVTHLKEYVAGRGPPMKTLHFVNPGQMGGLTLLDFLGLQAAPPETKFVLRYEKTAAAKRRLLQQCHPAHAEQLGQDEQGVPVFRDPEEVAAMFEENLYDFVGTPGFVEVVPSRPLRTTPRWTGSPGTGLDCSRFTVLQCQIWRRCFPLPGPRYPRLPQCRFTGTWAASLTHSVQCKGKVVKKESFFGLKLILRRNKMTPREVKMEEQSSKKVTSFLQQMHISLSWRKINLTKKRLLQPLQFEDQGGNQQVFW